MAIIERPPARWRERAAGRPALAVTRRASAAGGSALARGALAAVITSSSWVAVAVGVAASY